MAKFSLRAIYKNPKWTGQTAAELARLQSIIDLRRRRSEDHSNSKYRRGFDISHRSRIVINVGGLRFETLDSTLARYPHTLLGNERRRALFYDKERHEYFFDRHRLCFEAILYYYQSHGRLRRPENVPLDTFLEEIHYFDLGSDALQQVRKDEDLEEATRVKLPQNPFYRHLWANLEYPQYSMTAKVINLFSMIFILLSAVELAVETLPTYRSAYYNRCAQEGDGLSITSNQTSVFRLCPANFHSAFFIIQTVCIAFFTIEFLLRFLSCPSCLDFVRSFLNWIDFLAILPYYITLAINLLGFQKEISAQMYFLLSILRIFRFIRIFKLYRIFQHIKSLRVLACTLKESIPDFVILLSFLSISGFLFGAAIYFAENDVNEHMYDSIPKATYYGIITLTAVGYGDMTPVTAVGRGLACLGAIYGISIVSMLVSVLVDRYQRVYTRKRFLQEDYAESMIFNDSLIGMTSDEERAENQTEVNRGFNGSAEVHSKDSDRPAGKVRFVLGYMSDDHIDEADQEMITGEVDRLADGIIGEFFEVKSDQFRAVSVDDLRM